MPPRLALLATPFPRIPNARLPASSGDDFEVLCSEPVEFISEYRLFVNRGMIIDCRRYRGDYRRVVDVDTTATAILAAFRGRMERS